MSEDREALFHKVRSLLKKAESTPFEEEAAAFFAKAQELVIKYAIDEEALWKNDPSKREEIIIESIEIKDRGTGEAMRQMLFQVANNSRCRMWYTSGANKSSICGFSSDVIFAEMLFASIRKQMNFKYAIAVAEGRTSHHITFRNDFVTGFSHRIIERLEEQLRQQNEWLAQERTATGESTALVIRDRRQKVDDWVNERMKFGRARRSSSRGIRDVNAAAKGRVAAESADISGGRGGAIRNAPKQIGRG